MVQEHEETRGTGEKRNETFTNDFKRTMIKKVRNLR
jgi:hypothetical protein